MASNEELALLLQQGNSKVAEQLWEQVRGWCWRLASGYRTVAENNRAMDLDDLMQCAYLGMCDAAQTYDIGKGSFITWMTYYVKRACRVALGLTGRNRQEHYSSTPADTPISEDFSLADTLEDESLPDMLEALERADMQREVRRAVDDLPERQREVIRMHYWDGLTFVEISRIIGGKVQGDKDKAMRALRRDKGLRVYYMPDFLHWGRNTFNSTWTSATEAAVLWRERFEQQAEGQRRGTGVGGHPARPRL